MSKWGWLKKQVKSIGWAGLFAGFLISVLIQPYAVSFVTEKYNDLGAPGYQTPELDTNIREIDTIYPEGKAVEDFDGLEWQSDYHLYRFEISNPSNRILRGVKVEIPLPGCAVYTNTEGPAVGGGYTVSNKFSARIQTNLNSSVEKYPCTKSIRLETLTPDESAQVEFVVQQQFDDCSFLVGAVPEDDYHVEYIWSESNRLFDESYLVNMESLEQRYAETRDMYQGDNTIHGPYPSEGVDWKFYGILTGVTSDSDTTALEKCHARAAVNSSSK